MKVRIERITYDAPTKADHLVKVPRRALYLSDEDGPVYFDEEEMVHKVAPSGIVCDSCGAAIPYPYVWVLVIGRLPWGVLCERCRQEHHNGKPAYVARDPWNPGL